MHNTIILEKSEGRFTIPFFEGFGLRAFFTTRMYNMSDAASSCRKKACERLGLKPADIILPKQVHGNSVLVVDGEYLGRSSKTSIEADALVTDIRGVVLGILTADCLPIFIYDPNKKAIALIHCGWRPLSKGIILKTVKKLSNEFFTDPCDLLVVFGPAIRQCCYEVGEDLLKFFNESLIRRDNRLYLDMCGVAAEHLAGCGVEKDNIYDSHICTQCMNSEFYSYRKEGFKAGRSLSGFSLL